MPETHAAAFMRADCPYAGGNDQDPSIWPGTLTEKWSGIQTRISRLTGRIARLAAVAGLFAGLSANAAFAGSANADPVFQSANVIAAVSAAAGDRVPQHDSTTRLVEGDILVAQNRYLRAVSLPASIQLWTDGVVPYQVDANLSESSKKAIDAAIALWNQVSGISLIPVHELTTDSGSPADSLLFQPGSGCASWVGRRGGVQPVWVAPNCNTGSVLHEIGHALGLEHEHTRLDREQYITIHWDNIMPEKRHNFDVAPAGSRMLGEYDYESIMHYGPNNFSLDGQPTITPLYGSAKTIGQRIAPSEGDLDAIAELYATDLAVVSRVYTLGKGSEAAIQVSNERSQGANTIEVTVLYGSARLQSYGDNGWRCADAGEGRVTCSLARLAGGDTRVLVLGFDDVLGTGEVTAFVRSKTPDDNPLNNSDSSDSAAALAAATALEDQSTVSQPYIDYAFSGGGAALWCWPGLLLLLLYRQSGVGIYRQSRNRVERFRGRVFALRPVIQA